MARHIDTRQEKAHFPNSKLVQQIREVIFFIADLFQASQNKTFSEMLIVVYVCDQRRDHSLSGCADLDSTPVLLGGTGVYHPPQSHYCSWSWN